MPVSSQDKGVKKTLAIIPAWNEEVTVGRIVSSTILDHGLDVVVVDDNSDDDTVEKALDAGATVLPLRVHLGAWGAAQAGLRYALRNGYSHAITMDADGQHLPGMIPVLLEAMVSGGKDLVIGSCPDRASSARRFAWGFFRALTGFNVEDITSGFRGYSRRAMSVLLQPQACLLDYQDIGVLLLAREFGLAIGEVPVPMRPRVSGHSRVFATWMLVFEYLFKSSIICASKTMRHVTCKSRPVILS